MLLRCVLWSVVVALTTVARGGGCSSDPSVTVHVNVAQDGPGVCVPTGDNCTFTAAVSLAKPQQRIHVILTVDVTITGLIEVKNDTCVDVVSDGSAPRGLRAFGYPLIRVQPTASLTMKGVVWSEMNLQGQSFIQNKGSFLLSDSSIIDSWSRCMCDSGPQTGYGYTSALLQNLKSGSLTLTRVVVTGGGFVCNSRSPTHSSFVTVYGGVLSNQGAAWVDGCKFANIQSSAAASAGFHSNMGFPATGSATVSGGVIANDGALSVVGTTFQNNTAVGHSTCFCSSPCTSTSRSSANGAVIHNTGNLWIGNGVSFVHNHAEGSAAAETIDVSTKGGAVYSSAGSVFIQDARFLDNSILGENTTFPSGALWTNKTKLTIYNSTFGGNSGVSWESHDVIIGSTMVGGSYKGNECGCIATPACASLCQAQTTCNPTNFGYRCDCDEGTVRVNVTYCA